MKEQKAKQWTTKHFTKKAKNRATRTYIKFMGSFPTVDMQRQTIYDATILYNSQRLRSMTDCTIT